MKVLIIGADETGFHIASSFTEDQYEVSVIDENLISLQNMQRELNIAIFQGSGTNLFVLEKAGIENADLLVACTKHDETNLVSCLLANKYFVKQKVAVVRSRSYIGKQVVQKYQKAGIHLLINISKVTADEIMAVSNLASAAEVTSFADKQVLLVGYRVKKDSPILNIQLKEIDRKNKINFLIACIVRQGISFIPKGNDLIQKDDYVYLLLARKESQELNHLLNVNISPRRKAIIAGQNEVAQEVAHGLCKSHFDVTMVCKDSWNAFQIRQQFPNRKKFKAISGNIDEVRLQLQLDASTASLFIAANNDDMLNISSGMVANYLGVQKTIAIINRPDLFSIAQNAGVDVIISPRLATARKLKKMLLGIESSLDYTTIADTDMEVVEIQANESSEILGIPLREIKFPDKCLVGILITKKKKVMIPTGDTIIQSEDKVIMVTMPESTPKLKALIEGKKEIK